MNKILTFFCLINLSTIYATGFDGETTIMTSSGRLKPIKELKVDDEVICYNNEFQQTISKIKGIYAYIADSSIEITTQDNIILSVSTTERFFLPKEGQWVCAKDLKVGNFLLNENLDVIAITNIAHNNQPKEMFIVTVDKYHNFLASQGKYIVHNGNGGGYVGFWAAKFTVYFVCHGTIAVVAGGVGLVSGPAGFVVGQALESTLAAPIETLSNLAGLAGGISGAVFTGPV